MNTNEWFDLQAQVAAHRVLLAFLAMKLREQPGEGTRAALAGTDAMLRNSLPQLFANWPPDMRLRGMAVAEREIDQLINPPVLDRPDAG